jgi:hypothetical protein
MLGLIVDYGMHGVQPARASGKLESPLVASQARLPQSTGATYVGRKSDEDVTK